MYPLSQEAVSLRHLKVPRNYKRRSVQREGSVHPVYLLSGVLRTAIAIGQVSGAEKLRVVPEVTTSNDGKRFSRKDPLDVKRRDKTGRQRPLFTGTPSDSGPSGDVVVTSGGTGGKIASDGGPHGQHNGRGHGRAEHRVSYFVAVKGTVAVKRKDESNPILTANGEGPVVDGVQGARSACAGRVKRTGWQVVSGQGQRGRFHFLLRGRSFAICGLSTVVLTAGLVSLAN